MGARAKGMRMNVTYDQNLKDYMTRKGYTHIELGLAESKTCCSGFSEISTGFLTDKGLESLEGKIVRRIPSEMGDVIVTARGLEYDDSLHFGLKSFLGVKDITVSGVRAWSL